MQMILHRMALILVLINLIGCATAQRGALKNADIDIKRGEYDSALKALSRAEKYTEVTPEQQAEIAYLRATCYEGLGKDDKAIETLKYIMDTFPETETYNKADVKLKIKEDTPSIQAQSPTDIIGWDRAKWGMTQWQIAELYYIKDWSKKSEHNTCLENTQRAFHKAPFYAEFYFDERSPSGKLIKVVLTWGWKVAQVRYDRYNPIVEELIQTYGEPNLDEEEKTDGFISFQRNVSWEKPSGKLRFHVSASKSKSAEVCVITFSSNNYTN